MCTVSLSCDGLFLHMENWQWRPSARAGQTKCGRKLLTVTPPHQRQGIRWPQVCRKTAQPSSEQLGIRVAVAEQAEEPINAFINIISQNQIACS
ncbi:hypothetical protein AB1N83_005682 [Pleurotus pulmonarius]